MIIEDSTRQPAPARYKPNWRRDGCENMELSGSAVDAIVVILLLLLFSDVTEIEAQADVLVVYYVITT